jgi:hypothetical protein
MLGEIAVADDVAIGLFHLAPTHDVEPLGSLRAAGRREVTLDATARRLLDVAVTSSVDLRATRNPRRDPRCRAMSRWSNLTRWFSTINL